MKKLLLLLPILCGSIWLNAQQKKLDAILKEGQLLFRLEKAAWHSSDDFMQRFPVKKSDFGGYVSYETEDHFINTIFFSKSDSSKIIARYQFDSIPKQVPRFIDTINQEARSIELEVIRIRLETMKLLVGNTDNFFSFYKKTSPNIIPISRKKEKLAYIVTGPQESGILLFGNDYKLVFNKNFKLKSKKKLHNSLIRLEINKGDGIKVESTVHSHVVNPYMDVTDICTILLYKDYMPCKTHTVIGKKYVTIFSVKEQKLMSIPTKKYMKAIKKINDN